MKKQIITLVVSSLLIFSCAPSTVSAKSTIYCKNFKEISLIEKNTINEQHISALIVLISFLNVFMPEEYLLMEHGIKIATLG